VYSDSQVRPYIQQQMCTPTEQQLSLAVSYHLQHTAYTSPSALAYTVLADKLFLYIPTCFCQLGPTLPSS